MKTRLVIKVGLSWLITFSAAGAVDGVWEFTTQSYSMHEVKSMDVGYTEGQVKYIFAAEAIPSGKMWYSTDDGVFWNYGELSVPDHGILDVEIEKSEFQYGWCLVPGNSTNDVSAGPYRYYLVQGLWELRDNGLGNSKLLHCLAADYNSTDLNTVFVGGEGTTAKLFKTANGGQEWNVSQTGLPSSIGTLNDIAICGENPQQMLCAYEGINDPDAYGLYKSSNGGSTWESWIFDSSNPHATAMTAAIDWVDFGRVFVVEKSPNPGAIWMYQEDHGWYCISRGYGDCTSIAILYDDIIGQYFHCFAFNTQETDGPFHWMQQYCPS